MTQCIAIDCRYVRERASGIGAYVRALVDWLPKLAPDVEWLFLRHPRANGALSDAPNVREVVVPYEPGGPVTMWALPDVVDLQGIDLFHATFNLAPARLPCPVVTTIHDLMWLDTPADCRVRGPWGLVETLFWRHGIARALKRSERILTVSEASARRIAEHSPHAGERTRVTPLAVDGSFRLPEGALDRASVATVRERYAPGARDVVLTVGQAAGYKNHEGVLRAFALAFGEDPTTHLVLVQRIGSSSPFRKLAAALGLEDRVHFVSAIPFDDLRALMWGALCLCHPSHNEGFGLPVAEAMACGCPVLTSNVSSLPEVTGGAALHVDPRDDHAIAHGLRALASDDHLRSSLRAQGLVRSHELSWRRTAESTLAVFREVLPSAVLEFREAAE
ncbi:MAG: glycosyltransferase family 4 protein [Polyangiales bacterium]